ncbi:MAG: response regulator [Clostridium butyricum]|nr:response regulator [Clostridium butyricum]
MLNLLIADDEPKIRRGIKGLIDTEKYNINTILEAEDGEVALKIINNVAIDIVLLDINMPFLNGIELLAEIRKKNTNMQIIIISGYDEFSYAKEALKYNVLEYVLKPIKKQELQDVIFKAINELNKNIRDKEYLEWANRQMLENINYIKNTTFSRWISNTISDKEIVEDLRFLGKDFSNTIGMIFIKIIDKYNIEIINKKWNNQLVEFAIENIVNEDFKDITNKIVSMDENNNVIIIIDIYDINKWINYGQDIQKKIGSYLKFDVVIEQGYTKKGIIDVKDVYNKILDGVNKRKKYSKLVLYTINYLNSNYYLNNININDIAKYFEVTSSYLSKVLKKETGLSFIEYLTSIRINKAMDIMKDPTIKIYDVAELVGYSNQHYFCRAFKKIIGVSPMEYKKGGENE